MNIEEDDGPLSYIEEQEGQIDQTDNVSTVSTENDESEHNSLNYYNDSSIIRLLDYSFQHSLTASSPRVSQPPQIITPLRPHQQAIVYEMEQREIKSLQGIQYNNTTTYINFGVLGDNVGSGKSLSILSHIARMNSADHRNTPLVKMELQEYSRSNCFTIHSKKIKDISGANLIIVPHTIFKQWMTYVKTQTTLKANFIRNKKDLACHKTAYANVLNNDFTLVSNTLFSEFMAAISRYTIVWKRIFIDEVDTIKISSYSAALRGGFIWFISATWPNFIMNGHVLRPRIKMQILDHMDMHHPDLNEWIKNEFGSRADYVFFKCTSTKWLHGYSIQTVFGGMSLLRTCDAFLKESQSMPPIFTQIMLCKQTKMNRLVHGEVGPEVQQMLNAGDVQGALAHLGVTSDTPLSLVEAINSQRQKDLERLEKTYAFKETITYANPQAKEQALESLKTKINSLRDRITSFQQRIQEVEKESCPICYCEPDPITMTPCCNQIFCGSCILTTLSRNPSCPMCRQKFSAKEIRHIDPKKKPSQAKKAQEAPSLLTKPKQMIELIKQNPHGRFLVFSCYENPFNELANECKQLDIPYDILKGNKDVIANTIKKFENGSVRVLFLQTESAGAGMNLVSASHVVLLHSMTQEEEKQAVGRAYRLGRTNPLHVVKLVHESEM